MYITFTSASGSSNEGWYATYTTTSPEWCSGTTTISNEGDTISDGSYSFNYHNSTNCRWKIHPPSEAPITLYFLTFNTEEENDVLKILDQQSGTLLAEYSGAFIPPNVPPPVICNSGKMFLVFSSNQTITAQGWEAYFVTPFTGINDEPGMKEIRIFPNPAIDLITIEMNNCPPGTIEIDLYNVQGIKCSSHTFNHSSIKFEGSIGLCELPSGLYFITVRTASQTYWNKLFKI